MLMFQRTMQLQLYTKIHRIGHHCKLTNRCSSTVRFRGNVYDILQFTHFEHSCAFLGGVSQLGYCGHAAKKRRVEIKGASVGVEWIIKWC